MASLAADLAVTALTAAWTFLATVRWWRRRPNTRRHTPSWARTSRRNHR